MKISARALLGAAIGAVITVLAHPLSRPFFLEPFRVVSPDRLSTAFDTYSRHPVTPRNVVGASLWLQLAAERLCQREALSPMALNTMVLICKRAEAKEPGNALWPQMEAVILSEKGLSREAYVAWVRASRCGTWNDYQTPRILLARDRIAEITKNRQAWQLAYVNSAKSATFANLIERYARNLLSGAGLVKVDDLHHRYATLLNGELIRLNSRSMSNGLKGANIVQLSAYPANQMHVSSPKRLWIGQSQVASNLAKLGYSEEAAHARKAYTNNESWLGLTKSRDIQEDIFNVSLGSVLAATLVGSLVITSLVGTNMWLIGLVVGAAFGKASRFPLYVVIPSGLLLSGSAYAFTKDLGAVLTCALACLFLLAGAKNVRKAMPEDLGPLFGLVQLILAIACGTAISASVICRSTSARAVFPQIGVPTDFFASPFLLGLACLFFSMLLAVTPIWAMVQKLGTPHVLGLGLRRFGAYMGVGSFVLSITLGPLAIFADQRIGHTLLEVVQNEPVHYIVHQ